MLFSLDLKNAVLKRTHLNVTYERIKRDQTYCSKLDREKIFLSVCSQLNNFFTTQNKPGSNNPEK